MEEELRQQIQALEERLKKLEDKVKRIDDWGTRAQSPIEYGGFNL